jgi:DNA polymerase-4
MTFSLNIKYHYSNIVKGHINTQRDFTELLFKNEIIKLFNELDIHLSHSIVQINITLSNFVENKPTTKNMFTIEEDIKQSKITNTMQSLRDKFGIDIIKSGGEM